MPFAIAKCVSSRICAFACHFSVLAIGKNVKLRKEDKDKIHYSKV